MKQSEIITRTHKHIPKLEDLLAKIKNPLLRLVAKAIINAIMPEIYKALTAVQVEVAEQYEAIEKDVSNFETHTK